MSLQELSLSTLASWSNKLESHIVDMQQMLKTIQAIKSYNQFYDTDSKRSNAIIVKLNEITARLDEIYSEIDRRAVKEIGIDFEVSRFSELSAEIDGAFLKQKRLAEEKMQEEAKNLLKPKNENDAVN